MAHAAVHVYTIFTSHPHIAMLAPEHLVGTAPTRIMRWPAVPSGGRPAAAAVACWHAGWAPWRSVRPTGIATRSAGTRPAPPALAGVVRERAAMAVHDSEQRLLDTVSLRLESLTLNLDVRAASSRVGPSRFARRLVPCLFRLHGIALRLICERSSPPHSRCKAPA